MTLAETIGNLENLDWHGVIFAKRPWGPGSESIVDRFQDNTTPISIRDAGYEYFLEVATAFEVLEILRDRAPSAEQRFHLLVYYAENDAYPEWALRD